MPHTHLHLNTAVIRRTSGRSLGTFKSSAFSEMGKQWKKSTSLLICFHQVNCTEGLNVGRIWHSMELHAPASLTPAFVVWKTDGPRAVRTFRRPAVGGCLVCGCNDAWMVVGGAEKSNCTVGVELRDEELHQTLWGCVSQACSTYEEKQKCYQNFSYKLEGKRSLERPRSRWRDNIKRGVRNSG